MKHFTDLTDEQWARLRPLLYSPAGGAARGRTPTYSRRAVVNGVLWVLRTGQSWGAIPPAYPSKTACHDAFSEWCRSGVIVQIAGALSDSLPELGGLILARTSRHSSRFRALATLCHNEAAGTFVHRIEDSSPRERSGAMNPGGQDS